MEDNLFIEYINSPYEEPQDMLPKIDETMLTDMESSLETDFKMNISMKMLLLFWRALNISESIAGTSHYLMGMITSRFKHHSHTIVVAIHI